METESTFLPTSLFPLIPRWGSSKWMQSIRHWPESIPHSRFQALGIHSERIFGDFRDAFTCFVAPNQYEDFVDILTRYKETGRPFFWFYPVEGKKNPKLPPLLAENIEVIYSDVS